MNNDSMTITPEPGTGPDVFTQPTKTDIRPKLTIYHANAKGTGAAMQIEIVPATAVADGCAYVSIAQQSSAPGVGQATGRKRFATFDWKNRLVAKLGFFELAETLLVLSGACEAVGNGGKGFFHTTSSATTVVSLRRCEDQTRAAASFGISRAPKDNPEARQFTGISLTHVEAHGLRLALEGTMHRLAFGNCERRCQA